MIGNFLGYFEKPHSYVKTALNTFLATRGKNWATFNLNIWSHVSLGIDKEGVSSSRLPSPEMIFDEDVDGDQCDQIGQFFALWATIQSRWQQLLYPNCPHC